MKHESTFVFVELMQKIGVRPLAERSVRTGDNRTSIAFGEYAGTKVVASMNEVKSVFSQEESQTDPHRGI